MQGFIPEYPLLPIPSGLPRVKSHCLLGLERCWDRSLACMHHSPRSLWRDNSFDSCCNWRSLFKPLSTHRWPVNATDMHNVILKEREEIKPTSKQKSPWYHGNRLQISVAHTTAILLAHSSFPSPIALCQELGAEF